MKNEYDTTKFSHLNHTAFGGRIYWNDFDAHSSMSDITARIISDMKFDKQCRINAENRDRKAEFQKNTDC